MDILKIDLKNNIKKLINLMTEEEIKYETDSFHIIERTEQMNNINSNSNESQNIVNNGNNDINSNSKMSEEDMQLALSSTHSHTRRHTKKVHFDISDKQDEVEKQNKRDEIDKQNKQDELDKLIAELSLPPVSSIPKKDTSVPTVQQKNDELVLNELKDKTSSNNTPSNKLNDNTPLNDNVGKKPVNTEIKQFIDMINKTEQKVERRADTIRTSIQENDRDISDGEEESCQPIINHGLPMNITQQIYYFFCYHLILARQSYFRHMYDAFKYALFSLLAAIVLIIHGILPFTFAFTGSNIIISISDEMMEKRKKCGIKK